MAAAEARIAEMERKLAGQRARSRMLKAELRAARQRIAGLELQSAQMERLWNNYLTRNGFLRLFALYANLQAAAKMMGLTVEQFARMGDRLTIAEIREMVIHLPPPATE